MGQGKEGFGTGVVAGGIGKNLAAGANQSNRGTDGTKTSHRVSFLAGEVKPQGRPFCA
jgi:hypothetical protein